MWILAGIAVACDPLDSLCQVLDDTVDAINHAAGAVVIAPSAPARLRPEAIYEAQRAARQALVDGDCVSTEERSVMRAMGIYDRGIVAGTLTTGGAPPTLEGTLQDGLWEATVSISALDPFMAGGYGRDRTVVGWVNQRRDVLAGRWIRRAGRRGVVATIHTTCNDVNTPEVALQGWTNAPLPDVWNEDIGGVTAVELPPGPQDIAISGLSVYSQQDVVCTSADPGALALVGDPVVFSVHQGSGTPDLQLSIRPGETGEILCGFGTDVADAVTPKLAVTGTL